MSTPHAHPAAITALVRAASAQKQAVALASGMTASAFSNVTSGRRHAYDDAQRRAIAAGLSEALGFPIDVSVITCHCDDPGSHRQQKEGEQ